MIPIKWKPKMKLMCHECHAVSKMIVNKFYNNKDMDYKIKCSKCGDEYCVTEDLLLEMQEDAIKSGLNILDLGNGKVSYFTDKAKKVMEQENPGLTWLGKVNVKIGDG